MIFFKRAIYPVLTGLFLVVGFISCEEELTTIGDGVIAGEPFTTDVEVFDVFAFNKDVDAVQSNRLPVYQLGVFNDPVYGSTTASITSQVTLTSGNPVFGTLTQAQEDNPDPDIVTQIPEDELVKEVFLYIPYFSDRPDLDNDGVIDDLDEDDTDPNNDSDGDGVGNNQENINNTDPLNPDTDGDGINDGEDDSTLGDRFAEVFKLDSIFGNRDVPFNIKVERSTFFLRDLDPTTNFQESQEFFSSQEFSPTFTDIVFFDGQETVDDSEILFVVEEDDPDTEDVDEAGSISRTLNPGIRVPLDAAFFQENILDKEGSSELLSNANFTEFFRGINISVSSDILLLLSLTGATIEITYDHNSVDTNGTADDTTDDTIVRLEKLFTLNLLQASSAGTVITTGNAVNTFINDAFPTAIANDLDTGENASKIYLKGGSGIFTELRLFDDEEDNNGEDILNEIRSRNLIINEANLVFYVDRETLDASGMEVIEPLRLYMYNIETGAPLYNFALDSGGGTTPLTVLPLYDGVLEESDGLGIKYTIRITDYINSLISGDAENTPLGLTVTSNVLIQALSGAMLANDTEMDVPLASVINPFGTVLFGSNVSPENADKRLQLQLFFTETD